MNQVFEHNTLADPKFLLDIIDEVSNFAAKKFVDAFCSYIISRPKLCDYIGTLITCRGSGWSYEPIRTFGLTILGIERVLKSLDFDVPVLVTVNQFTDFINKNSNGLVKAIISDEMYEPSNTGKHVFAIAYQKVKGHHILYVYDSLGGHLPKELLESCFPRQSYFVYYARQTRQKIEESSCFAHAIHDLSLIDDFPPPIPQFSEGYLGLSLLTGFGFFLRSQGEERSFDLPSEFLDFDAKQYCKTLFKYVVELELRENDLLAIRA
jgi:hypothetical protein